MFSGKERRVQEVWRPFDEQNRELEENIGQMQQVDKAAAQNLLSPFSSSCFRVKFLQIQIQILTQMAELLKE